MRFNRTKGGSDYEFVDVWYTSSKRVQLVNDVKKDPLMVVFAHFLTLAPRQTQTQQPP
jgi:hypothetical protein